MRYLLLLPILVCYLHTVNAQNKEITLEDVWKKGTFRIKSVPGFNAMKDGKHYTQTDKEGDVERINVYNLETGEKMRTLFDNGTLTADDGNKVRPEEYSFSKDEQKMLVKTEGEHIYRRSVLNKVYVSDFSTGKLQALHSDKVLHATFSPDGNKVAYVKDNNLYYKNLQTGKVTTVTTDGEKNAIINGNCDWVYEEEFEFTRAFDWSPDGKYLAYYRFDERKVPQYIMPLYNGLYPENYTYKYPKAGEPNSVVSIKIYDVASGKTVNANIGEETDQYIPRIKWTRTPGRLCVYRMNRLQNKLELLLVNASYGNSDVIYTETDKCYVEVGDDLTFLPDGRTFVFTSEQSGHTHIYTYDWVGKKLKALTKGDYDVAGITEVDAENGVIYYSAAEETPLERKYYSVNLKGKKSLLTPEEGTHTITTINGNRFFLDKHSRLNQPPVFYLRNAKGKILRTLEDNAELKKTMSEYALGNISFTKIPVGHTELNAWMITPPDFNANKKYPVLMYQYSGPGSQEAADRFPIRDFFWHQILAQKGYIVVCADGTGTGMRGRDFKKKTYLQLGNLESNDQIAAAKYLGTLPYVDKNRIGIWGWSYGGFMSSTCVLKGNDVFKMAIAVAPVTNWRYYDNIYTERYMRTPKENPEGYDNNAPEKMAENLKGKFLLIHGTADDNVHFQNAVMLTDALIRANKEFESEYYPDKNHGISGGITRYHLYKRMTDFVLSNL